MEVREEAVPVRPGVRAHMRTRSLGDSRDATGSRRFRPARTTSGLHDVDAASQHEVARLRRRTRELAGRDAHAVPAQRRVALEVVRRERLFEPVDVQALELVRELGRRAEIPARRHVAGHSPALVGIDHDLEVGSYGIAHGFDHGKIDAPVLGVEPELQGADAGSTQRDGTRRAPPAGRARRRRIGADAVALASQQAPQRLVACARPRRSQTATSTIQLRPWWKSTVSRIPWTCRVSDASSRRAGVRAAPVRNARRRSRSPRRRRRSATITTVAS